MDKLRLRFSKTGRAVYISHLDLMRTLTRAFKRAEIGIKYSEGFNPHPNISIALPLSVGTGSYCELMDFRTTCDMSPDDMLEALSEQLPEGIEALEIYETDRKVKELRWLKVEGVFEYDERDINAMETVLNEFYSADSIVISKTTKRGTADADIKPAVREIAFEANENDISVSAVISAQEPTLNPELLCDALRQLCPDIAPDFARFTRIEVYDADMRVFR